MTPDNFCYWLQGFFEMTGKVEDLTPEQLKMIQDHLGYVFQTKKAATTSYGSLLTTPSLSFC